MAARTPHPYRASGDADTSPATERNVRETFFYELLGPFADSATPVPGDQLALHSLRYQSIVHVQPASGFDYGHPDLRARLLPCFETEDGTLAGPQFDVTLPADWLAIAGTRRLDPLDLAVSAFELINPPLDRISRVPPAEDERVIRIRRDDTN